MGFLQGALPGLTQVGGLLGSAMGGTADSTHGPIGDLEGKLGDIVDKVQGILQIIEEIKPVLEACGVL
jgi:hypothetical protein